MGVKFAREYEDIHKELADAVSGIEDVYAFFEMTPEEWNELQDEERGECIRTLTDDVFYALGSDPKLEIGSGSVRYDAVRHMIKVSVKNGPVTMVKLV